VLMKSNPLQHTMNVVMKKGAVNREQKKRDDVRRL